MSQPAQRIQGSKTVADVERQANVALGRINEQIAEASGTGGVPSAEFIALQREVETLKNLSGGFADIGGTGAGSPAPNPPDGTVATDGITIGGDGSDTPIFLKVPAALGSGGTGIVQAITQQITTLGTAIAPGTSQVQPALSIPGVTPKSAAMWSLPNPPDATWQTGIFMILVCTTDVVTPYLVNPTAGSITPIGQLVNIKVIL